MDKNAAMQQLARALVNALLHHPACRSCPAFDVAERSLSSAEMADLLSQALPSAAYCSLQLFVGSKAFTSTASLAQQHPPVQMHEVDMRFTPADALPNCGGNICQAPVPEVSDNKLSKRYSSLTLPGCAAGPGGQGNGDVFLGIKSGIAGMTGREKIDFQVLVHSLAPLVHEVMPCLRLAAAQLPAGPAYAPASPSLMLLEVTKRDCRRKAAAACAQDPTSVLSPPASECTSIASAAQRFVSPFQAASSPSRATVPILSPFQAAAAAQGAFKLGSSLATVADTSAAENPFRKVSLESSDWHSIGRRNSSCSSQARSCSVASKASEVNPFRQMSVESADWNSGSSSGWGASLPVSTSRHSSWSSDVLQGRNISIFSACTPSLTDEAAMLAGEAAWVAPPEGSDTFYRTDSFDVATSYELFRSIFGASTRRRCMPSVGNVYRRASTGTEAPHDALDAELFRRAAGEYKLRQQQLSQTVARSSLDSPHHPTECPPAPSAHHASAVDRRLGGPFADAQAGGSRPSSFKNLNASPFLERITSGVPLDLDVHLPPSDSPQEAAQKLGRRASAGLSTLGSLCEDAAGGFEEGAAAIRRAQKLESTQHGGAAFVEALPAALDVKAPRTPRNALASLSLSAWVPQETSSASPNATWRARTAFRAACSSPHSSFDCPAELIDVELGGLYCADAPLLAPVESLPKDRTQRSLLLKPLLEHDGSRSAVMLGAGALALLLLTWATGLLGAAPLEGHQGAAVCVAAAGLGVVPAVLAVQRLAASPARRTTSRTVVAAATSAGAVWCCWLAGQHLMNWNWRA